MNKNELKWIYLLIGIFLTVILVHFFNKYQTDDFTVLKKYASLEDSNEKSNKEKESIIVNLSILLNKASQKVGQFSCQLNNDDVSANGGWCSKISGRNSTQHMTDEPLALALSEFLHSKRVASFGDGPGFYKDLLLNYGEVLSYNAFDGAPYVESTTNNNVKFLDLSVPIYHLQKYDWVISLEVAEHIPKEFEAVYLDNLVRHSNEGIILSWAKIGQGGHSHINNQDFPYIKSIMELRNYYYDQELSEKFKKGSSFDWFRSNINVFKRKN